MRIDSSLSSLQPLKVSQHFRNSEFLLWWEKRIISQTCSKKTMWITCNFSWLYSFIHLTCRLFDCAPTNYSSIEQHAGGLVELSNQNVLQWRFVESKYPDAFVLTWVNNEVFSMYICCAVCDVGNSSKWTPALVMAYMASFHYPFHCYDIASSQKLCGSLRKRCLCHLVQWSIVFNL